MLKVDLMRNKEHISRFNIKFCNHPTAEYSRDILLSLNVLYQFHECPTLLYKAICPARSLFSYVSTSGHEVRLDKIIVLGVLKEGSWLREERTDWRAGANQQIKVIQ